MIVSFTKSPNYFHPNEKFTLQNNIPKVISHTTATFYKNSHHRQIIGNFNYQKQVII